LGFSAVSIYLCRDEEQKQRWLAPNGALEKIGSFGLTEPPVRSATAGGPTTRYTSSVGRYCYRRP
jgi:glutaryl-CoA dehydrogenase